LKYIHVVVVVIVIDVEIFRVTANAESENTLHVYAKADGGVDPSPFVATFLCKPCGCKLGEIAGTVV
jgi:hypothetical protein